MKAIIVKDDDFKTIGFEVTSNATTLISWGISPSLKTNFQKEINVNDWMPQIIKIIELKAVIEEQKFFKSLWFDIAEKNDLLEDPGKGFDLTKIEERVERHIHLLEHIIKNIN